MEMSNEGRSDLDLADEAADAAPSPAVSQATIENRDTFLDAIGHELRAPVATLLLASQLLLREIEAPCVETSDRREYLVRAVNLQAEKLAKLIAYLLDVSRSGTGSLPLDLHETDLVALVETAVKNAQAVTDRHQIRMDAPTAVSAAVDAARIEQVLVNLLDNAIKYSPAGGEIVVEVTRSHATAVQISVTDHGIGVAPERRAEMFDRFTQLHDPAVRGLGLGLYLSRRLVELHDGRLIADFPTGGGTRLTVSLPSNPRS
jgi:signal transduction histidine kinase